VGTILSFQQFYGLIFALYCNLLHVKKCNRLVVATFIYRPKSGVAGRIYYRFMKYLVNSPYIDQIICFSSTEPEYYKKIFDVKRDVFTYVPFAIGDVRPYMEQEEPVKPEEKFILSVGKSNRDYDFLVRALSDSPYQVRILSDTYSCEKHGNNIRIYDNVFGQDYLKMLSKCYLVVVPLEDVHISAGQFVFLQSMMFGKPVIVTESDTVGDYIEDGCNGFIIKKEKDALLDKVKELYEDEALYETIRSNGRNVYKEKYSLESMARAIGAITKYPDKRSGRPFIWL
jgi:glycosyltransferase involved in cell wall biosynthesis